MNDLNSKELLENFMNEIKKSSLPAEDKEELLKDFDETFEALDEIQKERERLQREEKEINLRYESQINQIEKDYNKEMKRIDEKYSQPRNFFNW